MSKEIAHISTIDKRQTKALIFDGANKVEMFFKTIGDNLPEIETNDLIELHSMVRQSTMSTWKLQAQIISELHRRAEYGSHGIDDVARALGISRSQAYKDLAIWNTFFRNGDAQYAIDEKSFFQIALGAPDPIKAIEYVEMQKEAGNYSFSTVDFKKHVARIKTEKKENYKDKQLKMFMEIDKQGLIDKANAEIFHDAGYHIEMRYVDIERTVPKQLIVKRVKK